VLPRAFTNRAYGVTGPSGPFRCRISLRKFAVAPCLSHRSRTLVRTQTLNPGESSSKKREPYRKWDPRHALASGAIAKAGSVGRFRRNMPDAIPLSCSGGWPFIARGRAGASAARFFALRAAQAADMIGIRRIVISEQAKAFYQTLAFDRSPADPMALMMTLADIGQLKVPAS
jgi:hypothetical protein